MPTVPASSFPLTLEASPRRRCLSVAAGVMASAAILFGLIFLHRLPERAAPEPVEFLAMAPVRLPPPPPPVEQPVEAETPPIPVSFSDSKSDASLTVRIDVRPIDQPPVVAEPRLELSLHDFRPRDLKAISPNHIYDRTEVDRPPVPLVRVAPDVGASRVQRLSNPRLMVLMVVNVDGSTEQMRLVTPTEDPDVDQAVLDALGQWKFSPAIKSDRPVRCWVLQPVRLALPYGSSPFHTQ